VPVVKGAKPKLVVQLVTEEVTFCAVTTVIAAEAARTARTSISMRSTQRTRLKRANKEASVKAG
jgi:hypothetical protein